MPRGRQGGVADVRGTAPPPSPAGDLTFTESAIMRRSIPITVLALSVPFIAHAADHGILGSKFLVKSPGAPTARRIVVRAKEAGSGDTIVGNPATRGATLTLNAYGGTSSSQTFTLPAAVSPTTGKPFWSGDASKGFKYKDSKGENGPVKVFQIKRSPKSTFTIKIVVDAKHGAVSVVPPNAGSGACALFEIGSGDSYSVRFADGVNDNKAATQYKVTKPATAGSCVPCDFLDPSECLFPYPSDYLTTADPSTDTGRRVNYAAAGMPRNASAVPIEPSDYNRNDGFSPGSSILLRVPNIDLGMTGAAPITDIERSLDAGAPIVLVNATTLEHHLIFAEVDANAPPPSSATGALIIHPAVNFAENTRYIVALRSLKDTDGAIIPPGTDFLAYRDNTPTGDGIKEARRAHMESLFTTLAAAGVARDDLYLAWDFTVASQRNLTERMLFVRDDGFARLGTNAPPFTVTQIENDLDSRIYRRVSGTFDVERYVDCPAGPPTCPTVTAPAGRFQLGPDGLPLHQPTPQPAVFQCIIPRAALPNATDPATPARASIYGHGLLGSHTEVSAGNVRDMANEHNFVFCATKWIGMSNDDVPNAIGILQNISNFPTLTDRLQQSMLNQLFLARLMIHPQGFVSDPAFQDASGTPVIDTSAVFYDGNSQGGIFGGTVMAIAQDITRGVLGVPGMNYSLLLTRSSDFGTYSLILYPAYPNQLQRPLLLALIQMLWDRSEPNGYARHIMNDPLPGTPSHKVLLHLAFGDHQVANVATEIEARTIGASIHQPAIAPLRHSDVHPYFDIPAIPSYPFDGSALIVWDSGAATPPIVNKAPSVGADPHSDPRSTPSARTQKSEFLKVGGAVVDVCTGLPCVAP